jgi:flagellar basal-body rod protein FlgG
MMRSLWTAASGMEAQQLQIDVISNNLANANTSGFKKSKVNFQDLLYQSLMYPGAASSSQSQLPTGFQVGLGTRPVAVHKLFAQGDFQLTRSELDMAIEGSGFFKIQMPSGESAYTRDGAFKLNAQGEVVTSEGYRLEPGLSVPQDATAISIGADGTVSVMRPGQTGFSEVGRITLTRFPNPPGLFAVGRNAFSPTDSSGDAVEGTPGLDGLGTIAQGFLEMSNVNIVEEMVAMIVAQRAYEVNSKAIQTSDDMLQMVNNLKR